MSIRFPLRSISLVLLVFIGLTANAGIPELKVAAPQNFNSENLVQQFMSAGHVTGFKHGEMYIAAPDHAVNIKFIGAHAVAPVSSSPVSSTGKVQPLNSVSYKNLWDRIDLEYDRGNGIVRSTYTLAPGANPNDIVLRYNTSFEIRQDGSLYLEFETGALTESAPIAWQEIEGQHIPVDVAFVEQTENRLGFELGQYNHKHPLIIDPTVGWLTFMGDPDSVDLATTVAIDASGNIFISGYSTKNWGTPLNALTGSAGGLVAKLNSAGVLQWHTFIGTGRANSIAVNGNGDIWITGASWDWGTDPVNNHTFVGVDPGDNYNDIFVAKLNSAGALQWHTFHGHGPVDGFTNGFDNGADIAVDDDGNSYIAGTSSGAWSSGNITDFFDNGNNNTNMVLLKLNNDGVAQWNAFYGALGAHGRSLALYPDPFSGVISVYLTGRSLTTWGTPVDPMTHGAEATVVRVSSSGLLQYSTFLGPRSESWGIDVDDNGNAFVTGYAQATIAGETINPFAGSQDIFVVKLNRFLRKQWHTYLGASDGSAKGESIAVSDRSVYVSGYATKGWGSPLNNHSPANVTPTSTSEFDVVVAELSLEGRLRHHTFLGSTIRDDLKGSAIDANNDLIITGYSEAAWPETAINDYSSDTEVEEIFISKVDFPVVGEIQVFGNNMRIDNGDITATLDDHTEFGDIAEAGDFTISRNFTIESVGTGDLTLTGVPVVEVGGANAADFSVTSLPPSPITSLGSEEFEVTFNPVGEGVRTATISIASNDNAESPFVFTVQGTGNPPLPEIEIRGGNSDSIVNNGSTHPGVANGTSFEDLYSENGESHTHTFNINNIGTANLNLSGNPTVAISGPNAAAFTVTSQPATTVNGPGTTTFDIKYELVAPVDTFELRKATVTIANNDDDESPFTFAINALALPSTPLGGTLTGLAPGNSIVLLNTDPNRFLTYEVTLTANGSFVFEERIVANANYKVTILSLPDNPVQECNVVNGEGSSLSLTEVTSVEVKCVPLGFTVSGTVTGLEGEGLELQINGGDNLAVNANGNFMFGVGLDDGAAYDVSIFSQPVEPGQDCTISNGNGIIASANISDVGLTCVTPDLIFGGAGGSMEDQP